MSSSGSKTSCSESGSTKLLKVVNENHLTVKKKIRIKILERAVAAISLYPFKP
jgi:hypothetical protein